MIDPAIERFFEERKQAWLQQKIKPAMTAQQIADLERECEQRFAPAEWLPKAANRAGQMQMATHPCTFSHPSARKNKHTYVTPVVAVAEAAADGLLRTGNVAVESDALGNAAVLDVYKFLSLVLADGVALIDHIANDSEQAKALLTIETECYQDLKAGLMAMREPGSGAVTSSKIKQVYFPVPDAPGYHQLSLLSPSGLMYALRQRIDALRFSDEAKQQRQLRREHAYSDTGYREIYDITTIGYGGTKPQNISVLNSRYGGKAHLLSAIPPRFKKTDIHFPNRDFFDQTLRFSALTPSFKRLHKLFLATAGQPITRRVLLSALDQCLHEILETIVATSWAVRAVSPAQYRAPHSRLPLAQSIWLCHSESDRRKTTSDWLTDISERMADWTQAGYRNVLGREAQVLGPEEQQWLRQWFQQQREALR